LSLLKRVRGLIRNKVWQKLFENFLSLSVLQGLTFIIEFITLPYLTNIFGSTIFGLISFALSFILFLQVVTEYGFNHSGTRDTSKNRNNPEKIQKIYSAINLVRVVLSIICLVLLVVIINVFEKFKQNSIIFLLLFGLIIQSILSPTWFFRGIEKMKYITIINFIGKVLLLILIFAFIKSNSDYTLYAFFIFIIAVFIGLSTQIFIIKKYKMKFHKSSFADIKFQFSNGFFMFLVYLSTNIINNLNPFILGLVEDYSTVGIFTVGYRVIQVFILIISLITTTVFPHIVQLINENKAGKDVNTFSFIKKTFLLIFIIGIISLLFLFFFADLIVKIVFGVKYVDSINVIRILSFAPLLIGISHTLALQILVPLEFDSVVAKIYGSSAIIDVVLCFIFIPIYGYIGLCFIILITRVLQLVLSFLWIMRHKAKLQFLT